MIINYESTIYKITQKNLISACFSLTSFWIIWKWRGKLSPHPSKMTHKYYGKSVSNNAPILLTILTWALVAIYFDWSLGIGEKVDVRIFRTKWKLRNTKLIFRKGWNYEEKKLVLKWSTSFVYVEICVNYSPRRNCKFRRGQKWE